MSSTSRSVYDSVSKGDEVLVVEDELRVRDMLCRALKEMGFRATLTPTAEAANKALAERFFDIVILDLNLPGMDGMAFLKMIRERGHAIQVIILTGFGGLEAAKNAIHLDVVDFITKPYALGTLEVALDRARERMRARLTAGASKSEGTNPFDEPPDASLPKPAFEETSAPGEALEELERRQILRVLEKHCGNRALTATECGNQLAEIVLSRGRIPEKRAALVGERSAKSRSRSSLD